ncbi:MAG: MipA/OmpV family protein [Proteobacteria bacterium]|nr:MipA/OmpV family protein [Pseudomonadota bacterium]
MNFNRFDRGGAAFLLAVATCSAAAAADSVVLAPAAPAAAVWTITIGAETRFEPKFDGAKHNILWPYPLFDVRRAGTPEQFRAPRDGWGVAIVQVGKFEFGPVGQYKWERRENQNGALRGLGNVDFAGEAGGFAVYWLAPWLRTRAEVRYGFGGHQGVISDLTADVVIPLDKRFTVSGGPRGTFATARATNPYFGVSPAQSTASGLPIYRVGSGLYSIGVGAQARYRLMSEVAVHAFVEFERLTGQVAHAPLVVQRGSPNQATLGVGLTRSFDIKQFW